MLKLVPSDNASSQHSKCSVKQKHKEDESFWNAVGLCPAYVDP